ncbi:sodium:calcium antiporter [Ramlibacter sp.]|uniref:sodium:calcium antiporter n=1 Tax=Ramlibacter sp. TaxID=1917967 RepID=UPI00262767FA|nr:sodium:calcium antiporter [Ramlibacter sp.]MDB5953529.1 sodium:calcium antiporter [Ramlibacter sp.]
MLLTGFWFLLSAGAIYVACEYFVNGVEWLGRRLNLSSTATGTVLAAFGTALPESVVTFVAVVLGNTPQQRDIGVGAALGGPLVLATIAYGVVGLALLSNRRKLGREDRSVHVDHRRLSQDQVWFMAIFVVKVALGLVAFAFKPWLGLLFLAAYGIYVWRELKDERPDVEEELEPLKFRPTQTEPSLAWAAAQTLVALCVVAYASHVFVVQVEALATGFHLSPHLAALLLSPVATEMPETMNALIWVRQGRERLALANISGAMMIQATIPSALGIFFTPWMFDTPLIAAAVVTLLAVIGLWAAFRSGRVGSRLLASVAGLYLAFGGFVLWSFR